MASIETGRRLVNPFQRRHRRGIERRSVDGEMRAVAGQSQHRSSEFQCRWQPTWVQAADTRWTRPLSSRNAATLRSPSRMMAPCPGLSSSTDFNSPGATYSAKFFTAVTFSTMKVLGGGQRRARRIVKFRPRAFLAGDQAREQQARHHAVGEALAGIAGVDVDVLVAGIASDEGGIVDGVEDLPGPAMRDVAELRQQSSDPGLEAFEPHPAVVGFAGLVIGAADDEVLGVAAARLRGAHSDRDRACPNRARPR